jgi:hypothetical protein
MHILSVHNRYLIRGGEDEVFESEVRLLTENGCRVTTVIEQNSNPDSITKKLGYALDCVWSRAWYRNFQAILADSKPDVVHVHNFFP